MFSRLGVLDVPQVRAPRPRGPAGAPSVVRCVRHGPVFEASQRRRCPSIAEERQRRRRGHGADNPAMEARGGRRRGLPAYGHSLPGPGHKPRSGAVTLRADGGRGRSSLWRACSSALSFCFHHAPCLACARRRADGPMVGSLRLKSSLFCILSLRAHAIMTNQKSHMRFIITASCRGGLEEASHLRRPGFSTFTGGDEYPDSTGCFEKCGVVAT